MKQISVVQWNVVELLYENLATNVTFPTSSPKVTWNTWYKIETTMKLISMVNWNVVELFHQKLTTRWCQASDTNEKNTMTLKSNVNLKVLSFAIQINLNFFEAAIQMCSAKKVFLEISQNSQENTCAGVSFLIKLQASDLF